MIPSMVEKRHLTLTLGSQDSWAICRIFKKTNSTAQRALSHSWVSPLPHEMNTSDMLSEETSKFRSDHNNISSLTKKTSLANQLFCTNQNDPLTSTTTCPSDIASYKPMLNPLLFYKPFDQLPFISSNNSDLVFSSSPLEPCSAKNSTMDIPSMLLSMSSSSVLGDFSSKSSSEAANFGGFQEQYSTDSGYSSSIALPVIHNGNELVKTNHPSTNLNVNVVIPRVMEESDHMNMHEEWKSNLLWDSSSCPCDHVHSTYSTTTKCYT